MHIVWVTIAVLFAWVIVALFVGLFAGAIIGLNRVPPRRQLLQEILKVIAMETPKPDSTYGESELHHSYSWSKDIRTFRNAYNAKRTERIEAEWYPNKEWFFIAYNDGYRERAICYVVRDIRERTGGDKYGGGNKLYLAAGFADDEIVSGELPDRDIITEISQYDWHLIQTALTAAKESVESFARDAPAMSTTLAH